MFTSFQILQIPWSPCIMTVQYTGVTGVRGCSAPGDVQYTGGISLSTPWGVQYTGGISRVHQGVFSTVGDTMSTVGDTMSTVGDTMMSVWIS